MVNRKIKQSSVPQTELNDWGYPNDDWEFCGYDATKGCSMWRRKEVLTKEEQVEKLNDLVAVLEEE